MATRSKQAAGSVTIGLRPAQMEVFRCEKRFRVLVAGRRFGKTHLALVELLRGAGSMGRTAWYVAPSYRQAKRIAWDRLKELTQPFWGERPNETDLSIRLRWGGVIALRGADQYGSLRGNGLDFIVLDEYASMRPECWTEVLRPALADRRGGALFMGTPQGANHLMEQFEHAEQDADWKAFQFTTLQGGNVSAEELASAARELDERLYRQEFEASFEGVGQGQAYYCFSRGETVQRCGYQPGLPLIWSLDFNVNPMCSVLAQRVEDRIYVLDELVLPDSNTVAACDAFLEKTRHWNALGPMTVEVFGDASGHQRRTSGTGTDWSLIREFFARWRGTYNAGVRAATSNPGVRDRVALVNSRLLSAAGERRLFVDPKCRELLKDFERVRWAVDTNGRVTSELDKSDRLRTHISDALGYYVTEAFAMRGQIGERREGRLL
jgi:hypothetical protein